MVFDGLGFLRGRNDGKQPKGEGRESLTWTSTWDV